MVNSLFEDVGDKLFPLEVNSPDISAQMLQVFREVSLYYGKDATVGIQLTMNPGTGKAINFDDKEGIMIGSKSDITSTLTMICSNATTTNETAVVFSLNLLMAANVTLQDFILYPKINNIQVANTVVVQDNIGMYAHNYNTLFSSILQNFANDINIQYQAGWPLANIDPVFALIGGLLKDVIVTPYVKENYLYGGFSMQADKPTLESTLEIIQ